MLDVASVFCVCWYSLATMAGGVLAGTNTATQNR